MAARTDGQSKTWSTNSGSKCLVPRCERTATVRGCCGACMQAMRLSVKAGKVSWSSLVNKGVLLESRRGARSAVSHVIDEIVATKSAGRQRKEAAAKDSRQG